METHEIAKLMADRIGHGQREKCMTHADVAKELLEEINDRVREIALKHCDYPEIEKQDVFGHLWAIETTLDGIKAANNDLHAIIKVLQKRCGVSEEELQEIWQANT